MLSKRAKILLNRLLEKKAALLTRDKRKLKEEGVLPGTSEEANYISIMATHFLLGAFGHNLQKAVFKKDENGADVLDETGNRVSEYRDLDKIYEDDEIDTTKPISAVNRDLKIKKVRVYYGPSIKEWKEKANALFDMILKLEGNSQEAVKLESALELFESRYVAKNQTIDIEMALKNQSKTMSPQERKDILLNEEVLSKVYNEKYGSFHSNKNPIYISQKDYERKKGNYTLAPEPELDENGVVKIDPETGREIPKKVFGNDRIVTTKEMTKEEHKKGTTNFKSIQLLAKKHLNQDYEEVLNYFYAQTEGYKKEQENLAKQVPTKVKKTFVKIESEDVLKVQKELNTIPPELPQLNYDDVKIEITNSFKQKYNKEELSNAIYTFNGINYDYTQIETFSGFSPAERKDKKIKALCEWADTQMNSIMIKRDAYLKEVVNPALTEALEKKNFDNFTKFGLNYISAEKKLYIDLSSPYVVLTTKTEKHLKKAQKLSEELNDLEKKVKYLKKWGLPHILEVIPTEMSDIDKKIPFWLSKKESIEEKGKEFLKSLQVVIYKELSKDMDLLKANLNNFFVRYNQMTPFKGEGRTLFEKDFDKFVKSILIPLIIKEKEKDFGAFVTKFNENDYLSPGKEALFRIKEKIDKIKEQTFVELNTIYPGTLDESYSEYLKDVLSVVNPGSSIKTATLRDKNIISSHNGLNRLYLYIESEIDKLNITGIRPLVKGDLATDLETVKKEVATIQKQIIETQQRGGRVSDKLKTALNVAINKQKRVESNIGVEQKSTSFLLDSILSPRTKNGTKSTVSPFGEVGFNMSEKLYKAQTFPSFVSLVNKGIKEAMFNTLQKAKAFAFQVHTNKNLIDNREEKFLWNVLNDSSFAVEKERFTNGEGINKALDSITKTQQGQVVNPFITAPAKVKADIVEVFKKKDNPTEIANHIDMILEANDIKINGGGNKIIKKVIQSNFKQEEIDKSIVTSYYVQSDTGYSDEEDAFSYSDSAIYTDWKNESAEETFEERLLERNKKRDYLKIAKKFYDNPEIVKEFMDIIEWDYVFTSRNLLTETTNIYQYNIGSGGVSEIIPKDHSALTFEIYNIYLDAGYIFQGGDGKLVKEENTFEINEEKENLDTLYPNFDDINDLAKAILEDKTELEDKSLDNLKLQLRESQKSFDKYMVSKKDQDGIEISLTLQNKQAKEDEKKGFVILYYLLSQGLVNFDLRLSYKNLNDAIISKVAYKKQEILKSYSSEEGLKNLIQELKEKYSKEGMGNLKSYLIKKLIDKSVDKQVLAACLNKVKGEDAFQVYESFKKEFKDLLKKEALTRKDLDKAALLDIGPANYIVLCTKITGGTGEIQESEKLLLATEKAQTLVVEEIKQKINGEYSHILKKTGVGVDSLFKNGAFDITSNIPLLVHTIVMRAYLLLLALDFADGELPKLKSLFSASPNWWSIFNFKAKANPKVYTTIAGFYREHFKFLDKQLSESTSKVFKELNDIKSEIKDIDYHMSKGYTHTKETNIPLEDLKAGLLDRADKLEEEKKEQLKEQREIEKYHHIKSTFRQPVQKFNILLETDVESDNSKNFEIKTELEKECKNFALKNLNQIRSIMLSMDVEVTKEKYLDKNIALSNKAIESLNSQISELNIKVSKNLASREDMLLLEKLEDDRATCFSKLKSFETEKKSQGTTIGNEAIIFFIKEVEKQLAQGDLEGIVDRSRKLNELQKIYDIESQAFSSKEVFTEKGVLKPRARKFVDAYKAIKGFSISSMPSMNPKQDQIEIDKIKTFLNASDFLINMKQVALKSKGETSVPNDVQLEELDKLYYEYSNKSFNILDTTEDKLDTIELTMEFIRMDTLKKFIADKIQRKNKLENMIENMQKIEKIDLEAIHLMVEDSKSMFKSLSKEFVNALDDVENAQLKELLKQFLLSINPTLPV